MLNLQAHSAINFNFWSMFKGSANNFDQILQIQIAQVIGQEKKLHKFNQIDKKC